MTAQEHAALPDLASRSAFFRANSYVTLPDLMPPRLWRNDPDLEVRRFYGKLNRVTLDMRRWLGAEETR